MTDWMDDDPSDSGMEHTAGMGAFEAGMAYAGMGLLLDQHAARIVAALQSIGTCSTAGAGTELPPPVTPELWLDAVPEWENMTDYGNKLSVLSVRTHIELALRTGGAMEHVLIVGPPGVGKTTFARRVAADLGRLTWLLAPPYCHRQLPAMGLMLNSIGISEATEPGDGSLSPYGVLILDQLDRAPDSDPLMADALTWLLDTGQAWSTDVADGLSPVGPLTVVATVCDVSRLPAELLDRFPLRVHLQRGNWEESTIITETWAIALAEAGLLEHVVTVEDFPWLNRLAGDTPRSARRLARLVVSWMDCYDRLPTPEEAAVLVQRDPAFSRPSTYVPYLQLLSGAQRGLGAEEIATQLCMPIDDLYRLEHELINIDGYALVDDNGLRWITTEGDSHVLMGSIKIVQMLQSFQGSDYS